MPEKFAQTFAPEENKESCAITCENAQLSGIINTRGRSRSHKEDPEELEM